MFGSNDHRSDTAHRQSFRPKSMAYIHGHTHNERERATQRESEERGKGGGMKQHQLMCQVKGARSLGTCTRPHTHIQIQKSHQMSKNRSETYSNSPGIQNLTCCHHRAKVFQPLQIKNRIKPSETPTESASIKTLCSSSGVLRTILGTHTHLQSPPAITSPLDALSRSPTT